MVNSSPSKFRIFVWINRGADLRVHFNIESQWSVSREIVRIKLIAKLAGKELTKVPNQEYILTQEVSGVCPEKLYKLSIVLN